ncbi:MAG: SGNH/GDSL hydrolase family protein [Hyalangium sp.]|uniref:SGNH/GDSL hydrolase family protein n=1 Tax=Hyalangium sp. TaxID=2028555 RepID=UPI00389A9D23
MQRVLLVSLLFASAAFAQAMLTYPGRTPGKVAAGRDLRKGCALGDSLTYGHAQVDSPWPEQLTTATHYEWVNAGQNGDTTTGMLGRYLNQVSGEDCTVVTLLGGTNDASAGVDPAITCANLTAIADGVLAAHQELVVLTVPPRRNSGGYGPELQGRLDATNACVRSYALAHPSARFVDLNTSLADPEDPAALNPIWDWGDHLHPNQAGDDEIRRQVLLVL